ncbi:MAG: N-acetylmuramoyl-L-alanine amidase [Candidatus Peribacteraceae bacterium]|nr:N-acetylmuramoyl-L-alanine amidase [Candidatus Peribacteraceae bacterium]
MKKTIFVLLSLFLLSACQSFDIETLVVEIQNDSTSANFASPLLEAEKFNAFFFKFQLDGSAEVDARAWFRESAGSGQLVARDLGIECNDSECTGFTVTPLSDAWKFEINLEGSGTSRAYDFEVETKNISVAKPWSLIPSAAAQLDELGIVSREEWGADEGLLVKFSDATASASSSANARCEAWQENSPGEFRTDGRRISVNSVGEELQWPRTYSPEIKKIVIHHSAESGERDLNGDNKFDKEDAEIIVQAIYYYHTRTRGWGDIGYNFLVDPLGNIYEGRSGGDYVIGGHVYCANTQTIGVAFVGNFEDALPSGSALESGARLLGELANFYDLPLDQFADFHGKNTRNLVGHRDYGATVCPGDALYGYLPTLASDAMTYARGNKISDADFDFSILEKDSPLNLKPFDESVAKFRLKNVGRQAWPVGSQILVSKAEIRRNQGGVTIAGGSEFAVELGSSVASGDTAVLKIPLAANATPGRYRFGLIPKIGGEELRKFYLVVNVLEPTELNYEFVEATWPPQPFAPTTTGVALVSIRNKSDFTWRASGSNRMVLQTPDGSISPFTNSAIVGYLEEDTPPGSNGQFKMNLTAPAKAGRYYLEFQPAARGGLVLPDYGMQFHVTVREPRFSGELLGKSAGSQMRFEPGETKNLSIEFRNTSQVDWTPEAFELKILTNEGVKVGTQDLTVPSKVAQNAVVKIQFPVTASTRAGKYLLTLQPRWTAGKIKEMEPIDFLVEVNPARLMGELLEDPQTLFLEKGATAEIELQLKNTGNVVWNSRDVVLQTLPAEPSVLATSAWLSSVQPAKLIESSVAAGEIGTFRFVVQKSSDASVETLRVVPMLRGLGRIRGKEINLEFKNPNSKIVAQTENLAQELAKPTESSDEPSIRVKLSFESDKIELGGGPFAIEQFGQTLFRGNYADFKLADFSDGEYYRVFPEGDTILEIPNFSNPNWNGTWNYNKFRGTLEIRRVGDKLVVINELPLESYLAGIAEPAPSDPDEKKKLMALLARSYALYYTDAAHRKFPGKPWDGSDSPAEFQQYLGYNYEIIGSFREFTEATRGEVVTYDGAVVKTPYFTSSSGTTKTAAEAGWNVADFQFVKAVEDPWSCGGTLSDAGMRCPANARGHGVGVSGKGAAGLAREGKTAEEILNYFFDGVEVEKVY